MQPPSVSFPPLAYGAAVSWCLAANRELDLAAALDAFVFEDEAHVLGAALETLGGLYAGTGKVGLNGSPLFTELLQGGLLGALGTADAAGTRRVIETLGETIEAGRARPVRRQRRRHARARAGGAPRAPSAPHRARADALPRAPSCAATSATRSPSSARAGPCARGWRARRRHRALRATLASYVR
jgi:hypothetical protein